MAMQSEHTRAYNSFSGSDIRAMIGPHPFAELQAVSYSVTREKAPIYTLGSPDARAFSRGKRGVAGSLIWINFDRHGLIEVFRKARGTFIANKDDLRPQYRAVDSEYVGQAALFNSGLVRSDLSPLGAGPLAIDDAQMASDETSGWKEVASPWYSDQILPFDLLLSGTNENGAATAMKIFGLEILNEGSGISIDDVVQEMQATFVARSIQPWEAVENKFRNGNFGYTG